jgi:hypothetical protein
MLTSALRTDPRRSSQGKCPHFSSTWYRAPGMSAAEAMPCSGGMGLSAPRTKTVGTRSQGRASSRECSAKCA